MPEQPGSPGEIARQRELVPRLRAVVEAKEAENERERHGGRYVCHGDE